MFPSRSFTARLIIPLTAGCALVIAGGLFLDFQLSKRRIVNDLGQQAQSATTAAALRLDEMTAGVESSVRLLGEALHQLPDEAATVELLRSIIDSNRHIFGATVALAPERSDNPRGLAPYLYRSGGGFASADLALGKTPYWQEPWFSQARERGEPIWVEPYFDSDGGRVLMTTFSAPIYMRGDNERGAFLAVVTADIALADLHEYLEALRIDSAGFGFLLTRGGTLIGSPQGPVLATPITEVIEFRESTPFSLKDLTKSKTTDVSSWDIRCPRAGDDCRLRLRPAGVGGWYVGVVYSEERLLEPLRNYEARVLSVGIVMLLVLALLIGAITRRLVRPLRTLAQASEAIARGELQVALPKAETNDEVGQLLRAFDRMRRDLGTYIEEVQRAAAQRSRMDGELEAAREIQMAMLPQGGTAREKGALVELWARVRPAREVGGDLYSYHRYGDRLLFCIGDVSDKGVPAALFMARAISLIQQWEVQPTTISPELAMRQLNEAMVRDNDNCMFLTLLLGVLDKRSGELSFASGGHGEPRLIRNGAVQRVPQERGPALGLSSGIEFPLNHVKLRSGDFIALYTDGFDEAHNGEEEMLGEERMDALLAGGEAVDDLGERVFRDVDAFCDGAPQFDDMTLLLISLDYQRKSSGNKRRIILPIDSRLPGEGMRWLESEWRDLGLWEDGLAETQLVVEEVLCNICNHSGAIPGDEAELTLERQPDGVVLTFSDPGAAYDPLTESVRAPLGKDIQDAEIGGLGMHLITTLTDEQSYRRERERNILRVVRRTPTMRPEPGA